MQKRSDPQVSLVCIFLFIQTHFSRVCSRVSPVPVSLFLTPHLIPLAGKECLSDQFQCFPGLAGSFSNHRFSSGMRRPSQHLLYCRPRPLTHPGTCLYVCVSEYHEGRKRAMQKMATHCYCLLTLMRCWKDLFLLGDCHGKGQVVWTICVEIRLRCQHCVGVTLLMAKFKNKIISKSRCTCVSLLRLQKLLNITAVYIFSL